MGLLPTLIMCSSSGNAHQLLREAMSELFGTLWKIRGIVCLGIFFFSLPSSTLFKCLRQSSKVCIIFENPLEILLILLFCILSQRTFILTTKFVSQVIVLCCILPITWFTVWWTIPIKWLYPMLTAFIYTWQVRILQMFMYA